MRSLILTVMLTGVLVINAASQSIRYCGSRPAIAGEVEKTATHLASFGVADQVLADSLKTWLRAEGYLDADISLSDSQLSVTVGGRYYLKQIILKGKTQITLELNTAFTRNRLLHAVDDLLQMYYDSGYYYARAKVESVNRSGHDITINLIIVNGPLVSIAQRAYTGLHHTGPEVIDRYISLGEGGILSDTALQQAEREAAGIPFMRFQPPVTVRPRPGYNKADLEFVFREKKQLHVFGGGGYVPDDATGLVWHLDMKLRNIFGGGREVELKSERREKRHQHLDVEYRQPCFVIGVGELGLAVATRDYRDEFYEFGVRSNFHTRLGRDMTTGMGLSWRRVEPTINPSGYSAYSIEYSLGRSTIDDSRNPSDGSDVRMSINYTYRRYSGSESGESDIGATFNETRSQLGLTWYRSLIGQLVGHLSLNYSGLETSESLPPVSEMIFVGGPGSLRGYRNEQFTAQRTAFGSIEPRVRFSRGYLFVFYDGAYINRPQSTDDDVITDEFFRWSVGFGLGLADDTRALKLSLGWGQEAAFDQPRLSVEVSSDL